MQKCSLEIGGHSEHFSYCLVEVPDNADAIEKDVHSFLDDLGLNQINFKDMLENRFTAC